MKRFERGRGDRWREEGRVTEETDVEFIRTPAYRTPSLEVSHSDWRTLSLLHKQPNNQSATVSSFPPSVTSRLGSLYLCHKLQFLCFAHPPSSLSLSPAHFFK